MFPWKGMSITQLFQMQIYPFAVLSLSKKFFPSASICSCQASKWHLIILVIMCLIHPVIIFYGFILSGCYF
jgi:hypothetical protein